MSFGLRLTALTALGAALLAATAQAEVTLPRILTSHMVIQRQQPVHIWGLATPGEDVFVSFRGETKSAKTDDIGRWSVYLAAGAAGGPYQLTVKGTNTITLEDVLVGDVWVASGQSNMQYPMISDWTHEAHADAELPNAGIDSIRLLYIPERASDYPQTDTDAKPWVASSPKTAKEFSAVAWYFARIIEEHEHVPVGVIDVTWGGTVAEAWTRFSALGKDAALAPIFATRGRQLDTEATARLTEKYRQQIIDKAKAAGKPEPQFPWHPDLNMWGPSQLWNGMVSPLTPLPVRGVIWYQGETNSQLERAPYYEHVFRTLIEDWRHEWSNERLPFLYVQLTNFTSTPAEDWSTIRDAQRRTLALRDTAMVTTLGLGNPDNVHPSNKLDVSKRLAQAALTTVYGETGEYSGPLLLQTIVEGTSIRIKFDHASGLQAGVSGKDATLTGFEIAGSDGKFVPALAQVDSTSWGDTVVVHADAVSDPTYVRYAWANNPTCNLYNQEGLPASPFTTTE